MLGTCLDTLVWNKTIYVHWCAIRLTTKHSLIIARTYCMIMIIAVHWMDSLLFIDLGCSHFVHTKPSEEAHVSVRVISFFFYVIGNWFYCTNKIQTIFFVQTDTILVQIKTFKAFDIELKKKGLASWLKPVANMVKKSDEIDWIMTSQAHWMVLQLLLYHHVVFSFLSIQS